MRLKIPAVCGLFDFSRELWPWLRAPRGAAEMGRLARVEAAVAGLATAGLGAMRPPRPYRPEPNPPFEEPIVVGAEGRALWNTRPPKVPPPLCDRRLYCTDAGRVMRIPENACSCRVVPPRNRVGGSDAGLWGAGLEMSRCEGGCASVEERCMMILDASASEEKRRLLYSFISASSVARCSVGPCSLDLIFSSSSFLAAIFFFNLGLTSCVLCVPVRAKGELDRLPDRWR